MSDQDQIIANLKKHVRSLLIPAKAGLTPQQLERDYLEIIGSRLPLRNLGYRSTMDMVVDMPDVVSICPSGDGSIVLKGIPDEATKRIANLVARQKTSSKSRNSHHKSRGSYSTANFKLPRRSRTAPILPAIVKSELKDLLSYSPVLLSKFDQAYYQRFGRDFQYLRYGFYSMFEVLRAASDIVIVQQTREGSLLALRNNPLQKINPGQMSKPVQQRYSSSSEPMEPTPLQMPLKHGVTTSLQSMIMPSGLQNRLENPCIYKSRSLFVTPKQEWLLCEQVQTSSDIQSPILTPNSQRTNMPPDTPKETGMIYMQEKGPLLKTQQGLTKNVLGMSSTNQKTEGMLYQEIQTSSATEKALVSPILQGMALPHTLLNLNLPGQGSPLVTQKRSEAPYMQRQTSPTQNQEQVVIPSLHGQITEQGTRKTDVIQQVADQTSPGLQQINGKILCYEEAKHVWAPSGEQPENSKIFSSDVESKKSEVTSYQLGQISLIENRNRVTPYPNETSHSVMDIHEDPLFPQRPNSPTGTQKPVLSPDSNVLIPPAMTHTGSPKSPTAGSTEYFLWKLQKLEEEAQLCLAQKGPGGTIDIELKEKIRFVAAQHEDGLLVDKLPTEFKAIFEEEIPLKQLGFADLLELVSSLSNILHLESKEGDKDLRIFDAKKWNMGNVQKVILNGVQKDDATLDPMLPAVELSSWDSPLEQHKDSSPTSLRVITHDNQLWKLKEPLLIQDPTIEVPPDAVRYHCLRSLPLMEMGTLLAVFVESIISPNEFYVRVYNEDTPDSLENMLIEMRRCYSSENISERYLIPPDWLQPGLVCCVRVQDDVWWYRVIVHRVLNEQDVVVFYPDYGNLATVRRAWLRLLKSCYMKLAAQAIPSALAWVKPVEVCWTTTAIKRFKYLCDLRPLVAVVHEYVDSVLYLFLCDTTSDDDLYLHNALREEGHALVLREKERTKGLGGVNPAKLYLKPASLQPAEQMFLSDHSTTQQSGCSQNNFTAEHSQKRDLHDRESYKYPDASSAHYNRSPESHESLSHHPGYSISQHPQGSLYMADVSGKQDNTPTKHPQVSVLKDNSPTKHPKGSGFQDNSLRRHPQGSGLQDNSFARHPQGSGMQDNTHTRHPLALGLQDTSTTHPQGSHNQFGSIAKHPEGSDQQYDTLVTHPNITQYNLGFHTMQSQKDGHSTEQKIMSLDSIPRKSHFQDEERCELELPYLEPVPAAIEIWDENWPLTMHNNDSDSQSTLPDVGNTCGTNVAQEHKQRRLDPREESDFFGESLESVTLPKSLEEFYISLIKSTNPPEGMIQDSGPATSTNEQSSQSTEKAALPEHRVLHTSGTEGPSTGTEKAASRKEVLVAGTDTPTLIQPLTYFSSQWNKTYQDIDAKHISPILAASAPLSHKIHIPRITSTAVLGAAARMATAGGLICWFTGDGRIVKDIYQDKQEIEN
ncbi:tudor domain-containing protein 5 [Ambystoma mexicanum]|uniref:tudor domain-containing protein 5 n=1 Tax=Ambystoma mexicanum TaxID=8296 RepID=UPI0037E894DD